MSAASLAPQILTSPTLRAIVRGWHAGRRRLTGQRRTVHAFIEANDPYSHLLVQALPQLAEHHGLDICWYAVGAPDRSAAPEPDRLAAWAAEDAARLATAYGLDPAPQTFPATRPIAEGEARRAALGHYASGMSWFEGEWYWGVDRLHYLEDRLGSQTLRFAPRPEVATGTGGVIEVFLSLRSPYSYLAAMRMFDRAREWQADLVLRPVLPMVMRALPVPRAKRFYIVRDCKREAERLGLPFGKIADPVGPGVERGLAILCAEIAAGRGEPFLQAYMRAVWSQGVDPATDRGLQRICSEAGLPWSEAQSAIVDESWRQTVENNRTALFALGHWGVPTFRVGDRVAFGQDRLWQVGQWLGER